MKLKNIKILLVLTLFYSEISAQNSYDRIFLAFETKFEVRNSWSQLFKSEAGIIFEDNYIYLIDKSSEREVIKYEIIEKHYNPESKNMVMYSCIDDRGIGCLVTFIDNDSKYLNYAWDIFIFRYKYGMETVRVQYNVKEK